MADQGDVTFEWVDGPDAVNAPKPATKAEWETIERVCTERNWMSLNRVLTRVLLAKVDGEIVGFHVMQLVPHVEPLWVEEEQRGTGLAQQLSDAMVAFLQSVGARGWVVIADSPHAVKMCKDHGMAKVKSPVYMTQ
jgi:hypothetical protein